MRILLLLPTCALMACAGFPIDRTSPASTPQFKAPTEEAQLGPRPFFLADEMNPGPLKDQLQSCEGPFQRTPFSIAHRGAPLQFPEHTEESYRAAARMGAGIIECDVSFTADKELVCRHSQCDLHTTTDILTRPELASKCRQPFQPADPTTGDSASAMCCTSDITLQEFKSLCGKMDAYNPKATTADAYLTGTPHWRTDLYTTCGTLLSHKESLSLFQELGVQMTPELKRPMVEMPFQGDYTQADYASQLIEELIAAGVSPDDAFVQSFSIDDIQYWLEKHPEYGQSAIYLDGRDTQSGFDPNTPDTWVPSMETLYDKGVRTLAPPLWMLVTNELDQLGTTAYANAAKAQGFELITWSLERSGQPSRAENNNWYYQGFSDAIQTEGDVYLLLEILEVELGVRGVFSDWPATTTFFANCASND